jgi:hypothetical protein
MHWTWLVALSAVGTSGLQLPIYPLLRVRGGGSDAPSVVVARRGGTITSSDAHSALNHRPLVLDEVEEGLRAAKAAVPPDVLQVFRKVLGYVWPPSLKERLLLVLSIAFLVLAKALNVRDSVSGWAPWGWLSA